MSLPSKASHGAAANAFLPLAEKPLQAAVLLAAWSPTIDLLAVAYHAGAIAVHRLNWQRLWVRNLPSPPSAMVWAPGGEALTVGCHDGKMLLLASDTGDIIAEQSSHGPGALCFLAWAQEVADVCGTRTGLERALQHFYNRTSRFCPDAPFNAIKADEEVSDTDVELQGDSHARLALLGVAHNSGRVSLCSASLIELASVMPPTSGQTFTRQQIAMHQRLQYLVALQYDESGKQALEVRSTAAVAEARPLLRYLTPLSAQVVAQCSNAQQAVANAAEDWAEVVAAVSGMLKRLSTLMAHHGCSSADPIADLTQLLTTGSLSAPLESFLLQDPGERGLRSVARKVDGAIRSAAGELLDFCVPSVTSIAAHLGEVAGLPPSPLVQARAVEAARGVAAQMVLRCHHTRLVLMNAAKNYRLFFTWLLQCAHHWGRMDDSKAATPQEGPTVDSTVIAAFLAQGLTFEHLGPELQAPPMMSPSCGPLPPLGSKACRLLQLCGLTMPATEASCLELLCQMLEQETTQAFANMAAVLSSTGGPLLRLALERPQQQPPDQVQTTLCIASCSSDGKEAAPECFAWAAWPQSLPGQDATTGRHFVCVMRILLPSEPPSTDEALSAQVMAVEYTSSSCTHRIVDCSFFTNCRLAVLFAPTSEAASAKEGGGGVRLELWPLSTAHFVALPLSKDSSCATAQPLQVSLAAGAVVSSCSLDVRHRVLSWSSAVPPLTVSRDRGLCAVLSSDRICLLDLDNDEEEEEDMEQDG